MRFLFIDRVLEIDRATKAVVEVRLSPDEEVFAHHFPGNPIFPASLMMECFAQAATVLVETSLGFRKKAFPGYITHAKFRRPVRPGAELRIVVEASQWSDDGAVVECRAAQGTKECSSCTLGMVTAPLEDFYRQEHAEAYRAMYAGWLEQARLVGFHVHPMDRLRHALAV